jgi:hypothetical protein
MSPHPGESSVCRVGITARHADNVALAAKEVR